MSKLMLNDLVASQELDSKAKASVYGGSALVEVDNDTDNPVNNISQLLAQVFKFSVPQTISNTSVLNITSGNGDITAPVVQIGANFFGGLSNIGNATFAGTNTDGS